MRPLGIAALEDKIVQQAARTVLECIYEQDFLDSVTAIVLDVAVTRPWMPCLWVLAGAR